MQVFKSSQSQFYCSSAASTQYSPRRPRCSSNPDPALVSTLARHPRTTAQQPVSNGLRGQKRPDPLFSAYSRFGRKFRTQVGHGTFTMSPSFTRCTDGALRQQLSVVSSRRGDARPLENADHAISATRTKPTLFAARQSRTHWKPSYTHHAATNSRGKLGGSACTTTAAVYGRVEVRFWLGE